MLAARCWNGSCIFVAENFCCDAVSELASSAYRSFYVEATRLMPVAVCVLTCFQVFVRLEILTICGWPAEVCSDVFRSTCMFALRFRFDFLSCSEEPHKSGDYSSSSLVLILSACAPLAAFEPSSTKSRPVPFLSGFISCWGVGFSAVWFRSGTKRAF